MYSATVHLNDTELFPTTPTDEVAVGMRVKNARGTESRHDYRFKVDSAGPTISITTPAEPAVIGSHSGPLVFKVTDDRAGVDLGFHRRVHRRRGAPLRWNGRVEAPYSPFSPANPEPLCNKTSDMTRILHRGGASGALIYALAPAAGAACAGNSWELDQKLAPKEGWVCLAAIAEDAVGNRDVSAPLRVCLSDGQGEEPDCDPAHAPSCTDGCDPVECLAPVPFVIRGFDASNDTTYFAEPL